MLVLMKKKKTPGRKPNPNSKRSQGVDRHTGRRVVFHMDPTEFGLLEEHIRESEVELKLSAVLRKAVKIYLQRVGKLPPSDPAK
jgi:hypothetical protein